MYDRLSRIDGLTRSDHSFLEDEDDCLYLGEYTARGGYAYSDTNQLIINLKKPMGRRNRPEWRYKTEAISTVARDLRSLLGRQGFENATFIPVPPSKAKDDPGHDDRLLQILLQASDGYDADVRELILQGVSMEAAHGSDNRPSIDDLVEAYSVDEGLAQPPRNGSLVIFDDVLTTGAHYKAMQVSPSTSPRPGHSAFSSLGVRVF